MTRVLAVSVAIVLGIGFTAQARDDAKRTTSAASGITLTGCLVQGADPGTFRLTNVMTNPTGTTGAVGTSGTRVTRTEWQLKGATTRFKLREHVGHRVQVTGSIVTRSPAEEDVIARLFAARAGLREGVIGTTGGRDEETAVGEQQRIRVDAIRQIADTCP